MAKLNFGRNTFAGRRCKRIARMNRPENVYASTLVANLMVAACVLIDLFCMKTLWNEVQTAGAGYVWLLSVACAAALDVPLAIAAVAVKGYRQGMRDKFTKNITLILAIGVFCTAFAFSAYFRIEARDLLFGADEVSAAAEKYGLETASVTSVSDSAVILTAAMLNAVVPLLTSVASFVISFYSANPLGKKLRELQEARCRLQDDIRGYEQAIRVKQDPDAYYENLQEKEREKYKSFLRLLETEEMNFKLQARRIMMEEIATPEAVTSLTASSAEIRRRYEEVKAGSTHESVR